MRAFKALLLSLASAGALAKAASDDDIRHAITELQGLVAVQKERIEALKHEERRLADPVGLAKPSIYGDLPGTRAYTDQENLNISMDHLWLLICGTLVMFMQAGFAMVESGSCRFKNVQNVLLKNLTDVCIGTMGWYAFGWSFAYSGPYRADGYRSDGMAGGEQFFGHAFATTRPDGQVEPTATSLNWFFQWAFCSAAATIVSGGVAERVNFPGYLIFSFVMSSLIYPMIVSWTWGNGWIAQVSMDAGFIDFAGSGIVHMTGGVGALVGAFIAGPRFGRWKRNDGTDQGPKERIMTIPDAFFPHNMVLVVFGTFSLWFGWYGFNCGSTLSMHTVETGMLAAQVAMNTTIAAATGGLCVFVMRYAMMKKYDVGGFCNGILAGLVSITAGCSNMENASAFATAIVGAFFFQLASSTLRFLKIDDPVDAFAVHGACGAWGVLAAAFFDWGQGFNHIHGSNGFKCKTDASGACMNGLGGTLIGMAFLEILMIFLWVGALCAFVFFVLKALGLLIASNDMQEEGFDLLKHSPRKAYAQEATPKTSI
eukprot:CAMPEP_0171289764 /NCGR_PEP_ID=MMETSP0790-20130122/70769_1 /TAXON_ID=2925 /ORGANISM="Alexandrium catenella, Strain OF101" /LENGTH=540 /DNA_ID=CAMNT_0011759395 /DNA_START=59 /DNA_END=1681 /DNA_ORIENTATION=-